MKIITKNPRDVVPNILEKDLDDKIFIVLTDIGHLTYLSFVEEISTGGMKYQTSVGNICGSIVWLGYYSSTLEDYDVTNNALIHIIKRASSVRW